MMIFNYSAEEKKHLEKRDNDYAVQLCRIDNEIAGLKEGDPKTETLGEKFVELYESRIIEFAAYREECETRRFKKLGTEAEIIADAKQQVKKILYHTYSRRKRYGTEHTQMLSAEDMENYIKRVLYLHINALKNNTEAIKEICTYIKAEVNKSPLQCRKTLHTLEQGGINNP